MGQARLDKPKVEIAVGSYIIYPDGEVATVIGIGSSGDFYVRTRDYGVCLEALEEHGGDVNFFADDKLTGKSLTGVVADEVSN